MCSNLILTLLLVGQLPEFNYGKCSKILKAFHFLVSNKKLAFRARIHIFYFRIANREYPDQTASYGAV